MKATAQNKPEVRIRVGPVTLAYLSEDDQLIEWATEAHSRHLSDSPPDLSVVLETAAAGTFPQEPKGAERHHGIDTLRFWAGRGELNVETGQGKATLMAMASEDYERLRMKGLSRILVSRYLLSRGGMAFHAAGMIRDNAGYLFVGPSDAGKTTLTTLWPGDSVLGDDQILIARQKDGFRIYDTPYPGNEGHPPQHGNAILKHVYVLEQAEETYASPMSLSDAFGALSRQIFHIGNSSDEAESIYDFLEDLVDSVPVSKLHFNLTDDVWPTITEERRYV